MTKEEEFAEHLRQISANQTKIFEILERLQAQNDEMYAIFDKSKGFWSVSGTILKAVILISAGAGVLFGWVKWLKSGQQ